MRVFHILAIGSTVFSLLVTLIGQLAAGHKIVATFGGHLRAESEVGRASTFFFTFPTENKGTYHERLQISAIG